MNFRTNKMDHIFQILAVILAGVAAFFYWKGNNDGLYLSAVAAAVSFFLSVRFQVKGRNEIRESQRLAAEAMEEMGDEDAIV